MKQRVVWVHGIGNHSPGYSAEWTKTFDQYLQLASDCYLEVCWDTVFNPPVAGGTRSTRASAAPPVELSDAEKLAEAEVRAQLETILLARSSAMAQASAPPSRTRGGGDEEIVEWATFGQGTTRGLLPDWLANPDAYLGDFTKYLVSRRLRNAVKEKFKEQLRPLLGQNLSISVISHSWGTVVAYDSLLDLETEIPGLKVSNLITLGSPLWMVRWLLEDKSGRKAGEITNWVNIHARGDLVGSWLSKGFKVDHEFEVPNFGGGDAHGSYFNHGNTAVQETLIARYVLKD